ncbi:MAG: septum formation initiator family protein [Bacteroidetes bacterium]|nr:MAG: septum formation initiator family protein [Bacteroidota bacterium]
MKKILINKYFYASLVFVIWMLFFDQESVIVQYRLSNEISSLEQREKFYLTEIKKNKETLNVLTNDTASLEKFARETYYMKKANEDLFVVIEE